MMDYITEERRMILMDKEEQPIGKVRSRVEELRK